jgi:retron-type reverse transcriptase
MGLIQKRIQDQRILNLLRTGLKAKVFEKDKPAFTLQIGKGSILSPLLSNIYLHELDNYMQTLVYQGPTKPKDRKKNPIADAAETKKHMIDLKSLVSR